MSEKKFVLNDLRISYSGPIDVNEFMAEADSWIIKNGYHKENKKYSEHLLKNGKQIEWIVEAHKKLSRLYVGTLRLRALFNSVKEAVAVKGARKTRISSAEVLVYIDGIVESHVAESYYHAKPMYQFITGIIDKYIYLFWADKYDGNVAADAHKLFKHVRIFFSLQKHKYEYRS